MLLKIILYQLILFKLGNSVVFKNLIHIKTDKLISIVLIFIAFSATSCESQSKVPYSRTETVIDTIHGVAFEDPYRWLEDRYSTETLDWIENQNIYAEKIVGNSNLRSDIEKRLFELNNYQPSISPTIAGEYQYFTYRPNNAELPIIFRRQTPKDSTEKSLPIYPSSDHEVILDPNGKTKENTLRYSILDFTSDGNFMSYSVRDGGEDEIKIKIYDLVNKVELPDSLPWSLYNYSGGFTFDNTDEGYYYVKRSRIDGPRVMYHKLGTDIKNDKQIFGKDFGPESFISANYINDGESMIFGVQHGWARSEIYFKDLKNDRDIVTIIKDVDARFYSKFLDGKLYVRTNYGADKNRLLAIDINNPSISNWQEVLPESDHVMENFSLINNKFYVTYLVNGSNEIKVFTKSGDFLENISLPKFSNASISKAEGSLLLRISSFLKPVKTYIYDEISKKRTLSYEQKINWDPNDFIVKQVWRKSKDGTDLPMWIMHHKDTELNGNNPTWLSGYGGFYVAIKPSFNRNAAMWIERGGIFAVATLRGGSEYGELWHKNGMLLNKQNVFDDFIAAAEWLIDNQYTNPDQLGIQGGSNGGLLVGAAFTQRPELYGAVLCGFPDIDILRFPWYVNNNNAPALLEYGNSKIYEHFLAIKEYSPYQNIKKNTPYPSIMIFTGALDTRVPPLAARKSVARLQASSNSGNPIILRYHQKAGHAAGRGLSFSQGIKDRAMEFTFMAQELGLTK